ncbi:thioesterase family protein [Hansschlegelia sp. KR7-227]|uniref:thioesterase family protein n=1 Tax=Hansschlegelia sp. KR7-227 TaxID=3400914 RepID=UPI003C0F5A36
MTADAFVTPPLKIEPWFLDYNGHVNMAYHVVLADEALDIAFTPFKGGAGYVERRGMTTFAGEMHVRYLREIAMGDVIRGRVLMVSSDAKRAVWAIELVRGDGEVATTVEGVSLSVSIETRRVAPWPDDVRARICAAVERDSAAVGRLDWLGRQVSMSRN